MENRILSKEQSALLDIATAEMCELRNEYALITDNDAAEANLAKSREVVAMINEILKGDLKPIKTIENEQ